MSAGSEGRSERKRAKHPATESPETGAGELERKRRQLGASRMESDAVAAGLEEDEDAPASEGPAEKTTWVVPAEARAGRVDKLLAGAWPEISRAALQRAFAARLVWVDGRVARQSQKARPGQVVEFLLPAARPSELRPVDIPLDVLYEDAHLLAVNKPTGMVAHPGAGTGEDTLVHALLAHCRGRLSGIGGVERPGIVHRLDRETSGVMVVAKTDRAHLRLSEQFAGREVEKEYGALVRGAPALDRGRIDLAIRRHPTQRHRMAAARPGSGEGRAALTEWRVIERFGGEFAWLRCRIHTGRTHQIRVHLQAAGFPLLGDAVYGWKADPRLAEPPARVMLHAHRLALRHPMGGRPLEFIAPWPEDFQRQVEQLRLLASGGRR